MRPVAFLYLSCAVHGAAITAALGFSAYAGSRATLVPPLVQVQPSEPSPPSAPAALDVPEVVVEDAADQPAIDAREVAEPVEELVQPVAEAVVPPPAPQPTLQRVVAAAAPTPATAPAPVAAPAAVPQAWVPAVAHTDNEPPAYPGKELDDGREDAVVVAIELDERGAVRAVALRAPSRFPGFNREALQAARGWRFDPARRDGVAVASTIDVEVEFRLGAVRLR